MAKKNGFLASIKKGAKIGSSLDKPLKKLAKKPAKPGGWLKMK